MSVCHCERRATAPKPALGTVKCAHEKCHALAAEIHWDEYSNGGWYGYCRPCEQWLRVPHFSSECPCQSAPGAGGKP